MKEQRTNYWRKLTLKSLFIIMYILANLGKFSPFLRIADLAIILNKDTQKIAVSFTILSKSQIIFAFIGRS